MCDPSLSISVIIPCWRDEQRVVDFLRENAGLLDMAQFIVAVASPVSSFVSVLENLGVQVVVCRRLGRGMQMNEGAAAATGDVLVFHHADSHLRAGHLETLRERLRENPLTVGGAFHRKFDLRHPRLRWLEPLERWHCASFGTLYGDQSVFIRRAHFRAIGGFAEYPLLEDVDFSARLRRSGPVIVLDPPMETSPRRHLERGAWRTTLQNMFTLMLFTAGVSPVTLHRWYYAGQGMSDGKREALEGKSVSLPSASP